MPDTNPTAPQASLASLVGGLIEDTQRLIRQEVALARSEVEREWNKTKEGAAFLAGAQAVFTLVAILLGFTLVKMLQHFVLPDSEWACFAIVTAVFAVGGLVLLFAGVRKFKQIGAMTQTVESIRQDVEAVTSVVTAERPQGSALVNQR